MNLGAYCNRISTPLDKDNETEAWVDIGTPLAASPVSTEYWKDEELRRPRFLSVNDGQKTEAV
jgi:hypothetical protein